MQNQKKYILKGNIKNPSWELRNNEVFIKKSDKEGMREIQYVPGADSIWKHENEKQGKAKSIWFTDGDILVNADDKVQIEFIEKHPDFGRKYELFDPEVKAEQEYKLFELVEKATELLRKNQDEDTMAATAASLFGAQSMNWGAKQTKMRCFAYAKEKPKEVIEALNDPAVEAKYIAALGLRKKVVTTNPQRTAVIWNDKDQGVVCHVPSGKKALTVLGDFLFDKDNLVTLQEIGNRIDALDGKKPKPIKKEKAKENSDKEDI